MRFTKMHGLGNDYVYVNSFAESLPADLPRLAVAVSDRHFGIGGDGLILIGPSERADARMRMFNADGSEAEMCGNGVRCVAKYVYDHGIAKKPELKIQTGRGVLTLQVFPGKGGKIEKVRVDMGSPILEAAKIPAKFACHRVVNLPALQDLIDPSESWADEGAVDRSITCVSMGNPHLIIYCEHVAEIPLEHVGPRLEHGAYFPNRINVHFVQVVSPKEVVMRTWERGSGITLACGTGACAVCVAGVLTGRTERTILAHLPGGDLELEWPSEESSVFMTGPATEVFSGDWP
jgi:diaminopimelate epimerase